MKNISFKLQVYAYENIQKHLNPSVPMNIDIIFSFSTGFSQEAAEGNCTFKE